MIGLSFDPAQQQKQQNGASGPNTGSAPQGVQEAIKILSLRLPRVVGANAISPQALLSSPGGSGGMVDSVVSRVLQRYFPNASPQTQQQVFAPALASAGQSPNQPEKRSPFPSQPEKFSPFGAPRITADLPVLPFYGGSKIPPGQPGWVGVDGGGFPYPATIAPAPPFDAQPPMGPPFSPNDPYPPI